MCDNAVWRQEHTELLKTQDTPKIINCTFMTYLALAQYFTKTLIHCLLLTILVCGSPG